MRRVNVLSVFGVLAVLMGGVLLSAGPAWAVVCPVTVTAWAALPTCTDQDKDYTFISTTLPANTNLSVNTLFLGGIDIHNLNLNFPDPLVTAGSPYNIHYTVQINGTAIPGAFFGQVSVDTDVPGGTEGASVTKTVKNAALATIATVTSLDGAPSGEANLFPPNIQFIDVTEVFTVGALGAINGATDTYTEFGVVPEPASLLLMGLGLAGLGLLRRKKSA